MRFNKSRNNNDIVSFLGMPERPHTAKLPIGTFKVESPYEGLPHGWMQVWVEHPSSGVKKYFYSPGHTKLRSRNEVNLFLKCLENSGCEIAARDLFAMEQAKLKDKDKTEGELSDDDQDD